MSLLRELGVGGRRGGKGPKGGGDGSEDEEDEAAKVKAKYLELRGQLVEALTSAEGVPPGLYAARDLQLHQLQDGELQEEYAWYSELYLAEATAAAVRGMAEMTLMKMGDLLDTPHARRVKLVAKAAEEQRQARPLAARGRCASLLVPRACAPILGGLDWLVTAAPPAAFRTTCPAPNTPHPAPRATHPFATHPVL